MKTNKIEQVWDTVMNNTRKNFDLMMERDDDTKCVRAKVFFHLLTVIIEYNKLYDGKLKMPFQLMTKFISGDFFSTIVYLRYYNFIDFDISEDDITVSLGENIFDNKNIDFDEDNNERSLHSGDKIAEPIDTEIIKQRLSIVSVSNEDFRKF